MAVLAVLGNGLSVVDEAVPAPSPPRRPARRKPARAVVIDCETTGLSPDHGDRMVSFAAIELFACEPTGRTWSGFFNPGRKSHARALAVHGLADAFLATQRPFGEQAAAIDDFLGDDLLVGHNVDFDLRFLRAEMRRAGRPGLYGKSACTMMLFRRRFPGERSSLDCACDAFAIDRIARAEIHGALVDAELTARVYRGLMAHPSPAKRERDSRA